MKLANLTPAMKQYMNMKQQNPDAILFFRIGDFYEVFFEDAKICATVLDLVITSKNKNSEDPIPMAGIPHHSIEKYIPKLIAKGYKVAIAEQTSDPVPGKIVQREVKTIITPGTYLSEQQKYSHYILAISLQNKNTGVGYHIAWGDFGLGNYFTKSFQDLGKLQKFILQLAPKEIIVDTDIPFKEEFISPIQQYLDCLVSVYGVPQDPEHFLKTVCQVQHLSSFGQALQEGRIEVLSLLLAYIQHTQQQKITNIAKISLHSTEGAVLLDEVSIKNLELFLSTYESNKKYSVFGIMNTTKTAGGSRLFAEILKNPLNKKSELEWRLVQIAYYQQFDATRAMHQAFASFHDLPRLVSLILYKNGRYPPFQKLRAVLEMVFAQEDQIFLSELKRIGLDAQSLTALTSLYDLLQQALKADIELLGDDNFIADGYDEEIDRLRKLAYHSDDELFSYQQQLVQKTGINNIKVKYIINQGYFLELTSKDAQLFDQFIKTHPLDPADPLLAEKWSFVRRQTLKSNQRYTSPYLDVLQEKILDAK